MFKMPALRRIRAFTPLKNDKEAIALAYAALYRKLRPKTFDGVIGQPHITATLKNQVISGRVSHAYLFCGTRGTGKTSAAKIFARAVNCENPSDGNPCNACPTCDGITRAVNLNVVEIDAASNNGVDNIRDILEEVKYPPTEGKYRIYIIDETHMLSAGAFNALLKTLEEPPAYTIFILATTDPQKIPATVLSRVQRFDFRRIGQQEMVKTLRRFMDEEGVKIDDDALYYIVSVSDGAMRDALSALDQCASFYYGETVTLEKALDVMGAADNKYFFRLADALAAYDGAACLEVIEETSMMGRDITAFAADAAVHFRNLLVAESVKDASSSLPYSKETIALLYEQAERIGGEKLFGYARAFAEMHSELRYAANPRALLEISCLKICHPSARRGDSDISAVLERIDKLEAEIQKMEAPAAVTTARETPKAEKKTKRIKSAAPDDIKEVIDNWQKVVSRFAAPLRHYLESCEPIFVKGQTLSIVAENPSVESLVRQKETEIQEALADVFGRGFSLDFLSRERGAGRGADFSDKDYTDVLGDDIIFT
ncbi:MAG: DNA polymerase III subunit gamma/tau [Clostridiales bacterium]|jgi:DNA polymerase-3 subunit gamma/tau|nr:DNA polymerase III subunit gamma/tau [Clostridiales bacterium]